jgi:hypothetical protein
MRAEQDYFRQKLRRHNRFLHGWGVVCGLTVVAPVKSDPPWQVTICPGYAVTPQGDEVLLNDPVTLDIALGKQDPEPCCEPWPCPPPSTHAGGKGHDKRQVVYIAIRYAECQSRPVRVHPAGCGCDESGCEYSRIRDGYEIKVLLDLPQSHITAATEDATLRAMLKAALASAPFGGGFQSLQSGQQHAQRQEMDAQQRDDLRMQQQQRQLEYLQQAQQRQHQSPAPPPEPAPRAMPAPCRECIDDPWVVIAAVKLPSAADTFIQEADISYAPRRVLLSMTDLLALLT